MKRSDVNRLIEEAFEFFERMKFALPPFAWWTLDDWRSKGDVVRDLIECNQGWDITDFDSGSFYTSGLLLFTLRNGRPENWATQTGKLYAEKIMIVHDEQITPMHFHWAKMEDIINRGGGELVIELFNATDDDALDMSDVTVRVDGLQRTIPAGGWVRLKPGESISLPTRLYHSFWAEGGMTLVGEVSLVNDDDKDNRFLKPCGRFPDIEEDEAITYPLVQDIKALFGGSDS